MFIVYYTSYLLVQFDVCLLLVYAYTVLSMNSANKVEYIIEHRVYVDVSVVDRGGS